MAAKKAAPKKAAPSAKKAPIDYPKGASERSKKAESKRMNAKAREISWDKFTKRMYDYNKSSALRSKYTNWVGEGEGGGFYSSGLARKDDQKRAKEAATKAKTASQQMKQGVTKSGGYAAPYLGNAIADARKAKRSDKFKAEQAVKKSGGSLSRNAGNKKKNAK
jgi:hypothetical protein